MIRTIALVIAALAVWTCGAYGDNRDHNFPESAFDYAALVEPQLSVPPRIDLSEGVEIPMYVDGSPPPGSAHIATIRAASAKAVF